MLRRMALVALFLGAPTALADGISVAPTAGAGVTQAAPMMNAQVQLRAAARLSGQALYKALLFSKSAKVPRPSEEGDLMF